MVLVLRAQDFNLEAAGPVTYKRIFKHGNSFPPIQRFDRLADSQRAKRPFITLHVGSQ
jgi:hypothetical protein